MRVRKAVSGARVLLAWATLAGGLGLAAPAGAAATAAAPAPVPPPGEALAVDATGVQAQAPLVDSSREARDLSVQRPIHRSWQLLGEAQYRTLVVRDEDPANDQRMLYRLSFGYEVLPDVILSAGSGVEQRFVSVEGESGLRFLDTTVSALYQHSVPLDGLGWERNLALMHRLRVYLPTSFRSQQDDLFFAAELMNRARVRLTGQLFAGLRTVLQYHAHEYAEQSGPGGGALPRFVAEALAFTEWSPLVSPQYGTVTLGADVYVDHTLYYGSRDPGDLGPEQLPPGTLDGSSILGAGNETTFASPHVGYDLYALYQPIEHLLLMASLEQAGNAVRYGETRIYLFNRDETELALRVIVTY